MGVSNKFTQSADQTTLKLSSASQVIDPGSSVLVIDPENLIHDSTIARRWLFRILTKSGKINCYYDMFAKWEEEFLPELHKGNGNYWQRVSQFLSSQDLSPGHVDELVRAIQGKFPSLECGGKPYLHVKEILSQIKNYNFQVIVCAHSWMTAENYRQVILSPKLKSVFDQIFTTVQLYPSVMKNPYQVLAEQLNKTTGRKFIISTKKQRIQQAMQANFTSISFCADSSSLQSHYRLNNWADLIPLCASQSISHAA